MNLMAYAGYGFYNAATSAERASLFSSYGLLVSAPGYTPPAFIKRIGAWFWEFFE